METTNRRKFLNAFGVTAVSASFVGPLTKAWGASCLLTPPQTAGPFYPGSSQFAAENDLTTLPGATQRAAGQVIYVKGKVTDPTCAPLDGAQVELWQACSTGKYNNVRDPNPAPLDPHFRYWAETTTNADGEYIFKTIVPGAYPASSDWTRPPHLHFRITRLGYHELVTQMYFAGDTLNANDLILQGLAASERDSVIVDFAGAPAGHDVGSLIGEFNITLRPVTRSQEKR